MPRRDDQDPAGLSFRLASEKIEGSTRRRSQDPNPQGCPGHRQERLSPIVAPLHSRVPPGAVRRVLQTTLVIGGHPAHRGAHRHEPRRNAPQNPGRQLHRGPDRPSSSDRASPILVRLSVLRPLGRFGGRLGRGQTLFQRKDTPVEFLARHSGGRMLTNLAEGIQGRLNEPGVLGGPTHPVSGQRRRQHFVRADECVHRLAESSGSIQTNRLHEQTTSQLPRRQPTGGTRRTDEPHPTRAASRSGHTGHGNAGDGRTSGRCRSVGRGYRTTGGTMRSRRTAALPMTGSGIPPSRRRPTLSERSE